MNSQQLASALAGVRGFRGVRASDQIWEAYNSPGFYIFNTDPSYKSGRHWLAVDVTSNPPEWFDSLGRPPSFYKDQFEYLLIHNGPQYLYNCRRLQDYGSETCGHYCIYYIDLKGLGYTMEEILSRFSKDLARNDQIATEFVRKRLN